MNRTAVFGLVLLLVISGLSVLPTTTSAAEDLLDLKLTNLTETSFTLSWTTANATSGYVKIVSPSETVYDVRGSGHSGTTHYVDVTVPNPDTTYTFEIYSNGWITGGDLEFDTVTTLDIPSNGPPANYILYGEVEDSGGSSASNTIVYLESQSGSLFEPISYLVESGGDYDFNLGSLRSGDDYHYVSGSLPIMVVAQGGNQGSAAVQRSVGSTGSPESIPLLELQAVDLAVTSITFEYNPAEVGQDIEITARVYNYASGTDANDVRVEFFEEDGDSSSDYVSIGNVTIPLIARGSNSEYAVLTWTPDIVDNSHNIKVYANPEDGMGDTNLGNNEKIVTKEIIPPVGPDLFVETITFSPISPLEDDTFDITVRVRNQGTETADCDVELKYNAEGGSPYSDSGTESTSVLDEDEYEDVTFSGVTATPSGTYNIWAVLSNIDPEDVIPDNNNDYESITVTGLVPDIRVGEITFNKTNPIEGELVNIYVKIYNDGNADANATIEFWQGDVDDVGPNVGLIGTRYESRVPKGDFESVTYNGWVCGPAGTNKITVYVPTESVNPPESTTSNNEDFVNYNILENPVPDLSILPGDIIISPVEPPEDEEFTIQATIHNIGQQDSTGADIEFRLGSPTGALQDTVSIGTIATGGSLAVYGTGNISTPGNYNMYVVIANVLPEDKDDSNDDAFKNFDVLSVEADMVIEGGAVWGPTVMYEDEEPLVFNVTVKNIGLEYVNEGNVTFYLNESGNPAKQIGSVKSFGGLANSDSVNIVSDTWDAKGLVGFHNIYAVISDVDPVEAVTGNNQGVLNTIEVKYRYAYIKSNYPADEANTIPIDSVINITFSRPMDKSATENATTLFRVGVPVNDRSFIWWDSTHGVDTVMVLIPDNDMLNGAPYSVTVTEFAKDKGANKMDGDNDFMEGGDFSFSFTTEDPTDTVGPTTLPPEAVPSPTNPDTLILLTAVIDDPQGTVVWEAEYSFGSISAPSGAWVPMTLSGPLDSTRTASANVPIGALPGGATYYLWVRGMDAALNWGENNSVSFVKPDVTPPTNETDDNWGGIVNVIDLGYGGAARVEWKAAKDVSTPIIYKIYATNQWNPGLGRPSFSWSDPIADPVIDGTSIPGDLLSADVEGLGDGLQYIAIRAEDSEGNLAPNDDYLPITPTDTTEPMFDGITGIEDNEDGSSMTVEWKAAWDSSTVPASMISDNPKIIYEVYYKQLPEPTPWEWYASSPEYAVSNGTPLDLLVTGLTEGNSYKFKVNAVDYAGNEVNTTAEITATPNDQAPPAFDGVQSATAQSEGGAVRLEWNPAVDISSPIEYNVYWTTDDGVWDYSVPDATVQGETILNIEGLDNDVDYWFRVWANDSVGNTNYSMNKTETAKPMDDDDPVFDEDPIWGVWDATDLEYGGAIELVWGPATDTNTAPDADLDFHVYQGTTRLAILDSGTLTYTVDELENDMLYSFEIWAVDDTGNIAETPKIFIDPTDQEDPMFGGINPVVCPAGTEGELDISWPDATDTNTDPDGMLFYQLFRDGVEIANLTNDNTYTDDDGGMSLDLKTWYNYSIIVWDDSGNYIDDDLEVPGYVVDTLAPEFDGASVEVEDTMEGDSIRVAWTPVEDEPSSPVTYNVYVGANSGFDPDTPAQVVAFFTVSDPDYDVTSLKEYKVLTDDALVYETPFWVVVRPVDSAGNEQTDSDNRVVVTPTDQTAPDFDGIKLAEDLETYASAKLEWDAADDNTDPITYLVYISKNQFLLWDQTPIETFDLYYFYNATDTDDYWFGVRAQDNVTDPEPNVDDNTVRIMVQLTDGEAPDFAGIATALDTEEGNSIRLTWNDATDYSTGFGESIDYHIYMTTVGEFSVLGPEDDTYKLATTTLNEFTVETDKQGNSIQNGEKYYFMVRAVDSSNNMDNNTVVLNATPNDLTPPEFDGINKAKDLEIGGSVELSWPAAEDNSGVIYHIYRNTTMGFTAGPDSLIESDYAYNTYIDEGLSNGHNYYYIVHAEDGVDNRNNHTDFVNVTVTDTDEPDFEGLKSVVDMRDDGVLQLDWDPATDRSTDPGNDTISYSVYRHTSISFDTIISYKIADVTVDAYTDSGLLNGKTYYYKVKAYDGAGNSDGESPKVMSGVPTRENDGPSLTSNPITPEAEQRVGQTLMTFSVTYRDPDGDEPEYVKLYIDGKEPWNMVKDPSNSDYDSGVIYTQKVSLNPDEYEYWFSCKDDPGAESKEDHIAYTTSRVDFEIDPENVKPTLSGGSVSPLSGTTEIDFTFTVTYADENGDSPQTIRVRIDGAPFDMTLLSGGDDYSKDSTFTYTTKLTEGTHTYQFTASDGILSRETTQKSITVEAEGGPEDTNAFEIFLETEYAGISGFVWLIIAIVAIVGLLVVASLGGKKTPPPVGGAGPSAGQPQGAMEETVGCPTCGSKLLISSTERPVTVECPTCNSKLKIS